MTKTLKTPAPKTEVVVPNGFTKVSEKKPAVKSHSPVQSSSKALVLLTKDGKEVTGRYHVWDRDMNAPHVQAKKGDSFFSSIDDGMPVKDVIGFHLL